MRFFFPAKLTMRRMFKKSFKKSKNSVCSSDTDQNRFVRCTDIQSFRGLNKNKNYQHELEIDQAFVDADKGV
jgi:hypothetical protein